MSVNQTILSGNLTAAPEVRFTPSGKAVANFTVANTPRKFDRDSKQWVDAGETLFQDVVVWENLAESLAELDKGQPVVVFGKLTQESWDNKQTGAKRFKHVLVASDVSLGVRRVKTDQPASNPANEW